MAKLRVLTDAEVVEMFGDPVPYLTGTGTPNIMWERGILRFFRLPAPLPLAWGNNIAKNVRCHKKVADSLSTIFKALYAEQDVWTSINDFGGCYMWRTLTGNRKRLSRHCWGIAVDLDVRDNPYAEHGNMNTRVVDIFEANGWIWGGRFSTPDPMHFEYAMRV